MTDIDRPPATDISGNGQEAPAAPEPAATAEPAILDRPEGPAAAALLATGIGALVLGITTTVAEASKGFSDGLNFYNRVGPLSGKIIVTVAVWLLSWGVLHLTLRNRPTMSRTVVITTIVLITLGLLGTFPTFFDLFGD